MSAILDALAAIADPLSAATYVRQESGLLPTQVGHPNTPDGLAKWDQSIQTGLIVRADEVEIALDNAAGRFTWPFNEETRADLWPDKIAEEAAQTAAAITNLAAEVTKRRVIADFIAKADKRAGLPYSQQASLDYKQADAILATAITKIEQALARASQAASGEAQVAEPPRSMSVRIKRTW